MKNNDYRFFYYEPKHFEELFKLVMAFNYEHNRDKYSKSDTDKAKIEERQYLKENSSSEYYRYYICATGNEFIGHVWFGQQDSDRGKGFIEELYVKPEYRKKGIATSLMKEAIRWITNKNCSSIEVDVKSHNGDAIRVCQIMGFSEQKPKWTNFTLDLIK
ncbi:MAG: GNAT family N-acetyltransferase [Saprospiraceae bacterium]|nr:GNAT family N-acetyltransferase [Lewinella sp.]